ncbi:MAG TPA: type I DNA topoisomerase, partial [Gaiellaceae bacterium]
MGKSLVIVESPAKARTIEGYLGSGYAVGSSIGHVRDLPDRAKDVPEAQRKRFGALGVDVDDGFEPYYVVDPGKKKVIADLKKRLADADELLLATDEDREGEAIAWHLVQVLKPKVPVRRMVFHEITKDAITRALDETRAIDDRLVDAQETRRILDRLYGYEVSPVLWKKVMPRLSAGRVQSVATRLVVDRERERMRFVAAGYWDIVGTFEPGAFDARLTSLEGKRIAQGRDFAENGTPTGAVLVLSEDVARSLANELTGRPFTVDKVDEKPYTRRPAAPFRTSTLQQEASRKLRFSSQTTMRLAQGLYENGHITYMRTDSVTLSEEALVAARTQVRELYGDRFVPDAPRTYRGKVKNAQEAHEAIRPAGDRWRTPDRLSGELRGPDLRLYDLIWKRTLASQMADAVGKTVSVRIEAPLAAALAEDLAVAGTTTTRWAASGRTITFPGYLRVYVEGSDDPEADLDDRERLLPDLAVGQVLPEPALDPVGHTTQPPARYTEASLVKRLEELGI